MRETLDDGSEQARWNGQVMERRRSAVQRLPQTLISRRIVIVAADVLQALRKPRERGIVDAAVVLDALTRAFSQLRQVPSASRNPDDGDVEAAAAEKRLKRGKDLLVREVS